jgi:hypothetical protein
MPSTGFSPSRDGFHFRNDFVNQLMLMGFISFESNGLCGGMALAALRYHLHRVPIPNHRPEDFSPATVPPQGGRLYDYLLRSQIESWGPSGVWGTSQWRTMWWVTLDMQFAWSFTDDNCEFLKVKRSVDLGLSVVIGLRSATAGDTGLHTVLAIGYDESPRRVYVYDGNHPDREMELRADSQARRISYGEKDAAPGDEAWASFFITGADPANSPSLQPAAFFSAGPPTYIDLALESGLFTSAPLRVGEQAVLSAVASNRGDHRARAMRWVFSVEAPSGKKKEVCSIDENLPLQSGEHRQIACTVPQLGDTYGTYRISLSYETVRGHLIDLPPISSGTLNPVSLFLHPVKPPLTRCRVLAASIRAAQAKVEAARERVAELAGEPLEGGKPTALAAAQRALQNELKKLEALIRERQNLGCP